MCSSQTVEATELITFIALLSQNLNSFSLEENTVQETACAGNPYEGKLLDQFVDILDSSLI